MLSTIKINCSGDLVKVAQYMTNYSIIDGIYNNEFKAYIMEWQKENNLDADGIIGKNSWTKMAKLAPTCSTSKNTTSVYVFAIQLLIGGIPNIGIFDTTTKDAVAAYQAAQQLVVDGICGPKTWNALIVQGTSQPVTITEQIKSVVSGSKVLNNCVKYLQWDSKWKNIKYSTHTASQTIGNSGCGPTSMAMIVATWIDKKITPVEMCDLAYKNGYRTYNSGTSWDFFQFVFKKYPEFSKFIPTSSVTILQAALKEGALAVCSMNSNDNGFWTKGGHFIVARGCDDTYIYANDPNKSTTPRKQKTDKFKKCMKQAFIFWPQKTEPEKKTETVVVEPTPINKDNRFDTNLDGKIIDISKWQGNINFDKLKEEVGLVIARASCGSDKDVKIDSYASAMIEKRIPFGVYCYSYAGTVEKARDEAQKIVSYAEKYDPLFYIMDAEEAKITNEAIAAFADELRKLTKKRIGCYVAHHRYNQYKYSTLQKLFDITWIPCYGSNNGTIEGSRKPSYDCDLWQYTSTGKIAGINGNVDMNITMKEDKSLEWFLGN